MTNRLPTWLLRCLIFLVVTAVYLYGFPAATLFYETLVLLHVAVGSALSAMLAWLLLRKLESESVPAKLGWLLLTAGAVLGLILIRIGTPNRLRDWLYAHIALCAAGALLVATSWMAKRGWLGGDS